MKNKRKIENTMALNKKKNYPHTERHMSAYDPTDEKFNAIEKKMAALKEDLSEAVLKCLLVTGRRLLY